MLQEIEKKLGMKLRGFNWVGTFVKSNHNHFVEFYGWTGEIYVKNEGIFSYPEYYKRLLNKGLCLYINGMMVAKQGYSDHFNSLHKYHLRFINGTQEKPKKETYPVINPNEEAVFESAVKLYEMNILSFDQLMERVKRYIQPEKQEAVCNQITQGTSAA